MWGPGHLVSLPPIKYALVLRITMQYVYIRICGIRVIINTYIFFKNKNLLSCYKKAVSFSVLFSICYLIIM